ncbi:shikimate dehydrogenase [Halorhodospira halophila]|uniref:Shikimate dehydrogenase (NADP(+)) n=1 Tax=Halorhodospira halophila (strain DSM 244 / SL1) TaxID=349124 RepID=AROE_HALHL|nr:shikimate dehydrogenase [Halorhodospira halophila]A1WVW8.1 RecName: Full=Shikimate dehydrogenase (NADP(+)); Short=SDH [Halorhodospira halophila SL1]ABM61830.1 shikimate dehydrogenase [Halorhodospira halophila SL1]MBK1728842.1 shikimate dehydrogenase (NADP+) [Halorhodospira halophila]
MSDHYAVVGNPIAHSKSPQIHTRFAAEVGADLHYHRLWAPEDHFAPVAEAFFAGGGHGLNVTVPFKGAAYTFADTLSDRARAAGAVNTLRAEPDGRHFGDNTDGIGLLRDLQTNHGIDLAGRRLLLLGAGGAARGVLHDLLGEDPRTVVIANRTVDRAEALAGNDHRIRACGFDVLAGERFEVVINTTAAGLQGEMPPLPDDLLAPGATAYDLVYADEDTPFMAWARARGAVTVCDGLGMLVEQAAESFYQWRGTYPQTAPVIEALRIGA